jgi:hypothetical protein
LHKQLLELSSNLSQHDAAATKPLHFLARQPVAQVLDMGPEWVEQARSQITDEVFPDAALKGQVSDQLDQLAATIAKSRVNVYSIQLQPDRQPGEEDPPLSWKLTPSQKRGIRDAWRRIVQNIDGDSPAQPSTEGPLKPADLKWFFTSRQPK